MSNAMKEFVCFQFNDNRKYISMHATISVLSIFLLTHSSPVIYYPLIYWYTFSSIPPPPFSFNACVKLICVCFGIFCLSIFLKQNGMKCRQSDVQCYIHNWIKYIYKAKWTEYLYHHQHSPFYFQYVCVYIHLYLLLW